MTPEKAALIAHFSAIKNQAHQRLEFVSRRNTYGLTPDQQEQLNIECDLAQSEYNEALNNLAEVK